MKTLCVYCSRTGLTEKTAKKIAEKIGAETVMITDGKSRKGAFGYIGACIDAIFKKEPDLLPFKTEFPICEYERIIIAAPVWCEDVCFIAKAFLKSVKDEIKGELCFVITHMSKISYENKIAALAKSAGKENYKFLSVKSKKNDYLKEAEEFAKTLSETT